MATLSKGVAAASGSVNRTQLHRACADFGARLAPRREGRYIGELCRTSSGLLAAAATLAVLALTASASPLWQLSLGVLAGGVAYIGSLWLFKRSMLLSLIKNLRSSLLGGADANRADA